MIEEQPHFIFTLGLPSTPEFYQFDGSRSRLSGDSAFPYVAFLLTRPLVPPQSNLIMQAKQGDRFAALLVRQYDQSGILIRQAEYKDVIITRFDRSAPDLFLEIKFRP
jgi:hypothetical protein